GEAVFDVTSFVKEQADGQVTFILGTDEGDVNNYVNLAFHAKGSTKPPQLLITYADPVVTSLPPVSIMTATTEDSAATGLIVAKNGADGTAVTHLKITGITGGRLFLADGTT